MEDHQVLRLIAGLTSINIFKQRFVIYHFAKACQERGFIPADNIPATRRSFLSLSSIRTNFCPHFCI